MCSSRKSEHLILFFSDAKAAMNQVTGNWACEFGGDGIRVNCVTPWYINTPLAQQVLKDESFKR